LELAEFSYFIRPKWIQLGQQLFHSAKIGKNGRQIGHLATLTIPQNNFSTIFLPKE
jgi:hypothetical protein